MSTLRPLDGSAIAAQLTVKKTGQNLRTSSSDESPEARQQREARDRLARAQEDLERTQREMEGNIDYIRDQYDKRALEEELHRESALENQRNKGYAGIRDLQRAQTKELERVQKQGDKQLEETTRHYNDAINVAEKRGHGDLEKVRQKHTTQVENELKMNEQSLSQVRAQQESHFMRSRDDKEFKLQQAAEAYQREYERLRTNSAEASEQSETHFKERLAGQRNEQSEILDRINAKATERITEIRQDTARKLAAYNQRQSDPFYKLIDLDASLDDAGDSFILTATIPEHEREHISVSVKGGKQIVLSGYRKNEEKLDLSPGRAKGTSTFQSFNESFPLSAPVDAKLLERHFDGDQLVVTVPKLSRTFDKAPYKGPPPEKVRVERPKFPDNIPEGKAADTTPINKPTRGSRPLG